jgi:hypothetical protein
MSEAATPPDTPKRKRGRPKKRTVARVERERKVLEAWDRRDFGDNKAATGAAFDIDRSDATRLINNHDRQKCRK